MPWAIKVENGKHCVYKESTGKIMHCYDNEADAKDYLAALYANAGEKELRELLDGDSSLAVTFKESDGRYKIIAVSTAALKDLEGETFDVEAIDYDAAAASKHGDYPEFRLFHKKHLGVGKVEKMRRVGIFAVDEGHSYTDPFSLEVCDKMLAHNDGTWRTSRGFYVVEASGDCPVCYEPLLIQTKHMVAGFKCPHCNAVHTSHKGVLKEVHFRKTRTFDVTITDNPAVPWTGVSAFKEYHNLEDFAMTKKQLEQKLLEAGISKEIVEAKLSSMTDAQLKEFTDIPFAAMLKEFDAADAVAEDTFALAPETLKEFGKVVEEALTAILENKLGAMVEKHVAKAIEGLEIDVADLGEMEIDLKEMPQFAELKEAIEDVAEKVEQLMRSDDEKLKELLEETPRSGKLRIRRYKKAKYQDEDEDEEDEDEEDEDEEEMPSPKKRFNPRKKSADGVVIADADGNRASSMTEFLLGS